MGARSAFASELIYTVPTGFTPSTPTTLDLGDLAAGFSGTFSVSGTLDAGIPAASPLDFEAVVEFTPADPVTTGCTKRYLSVPSSGSITTAAPQVSLTTGPSCADPAP